MAQPAISLNDHLLQRLNIGRVFSEGDNVESLDYHESGNYLITASSSGVLNVYDIESGEPKRKIFSKINGTSLVRFTHHESSVLYSGNRTGSFNYLSLHDNLHLRTYYGHSKSICSMDISSIDDSFLTSSWDFTARLWDLRSPRSQGVIVMTNSGSSSVAFDPKGLVFALGYGPDKVQLYSMKNYEPGPFAQFTVQLLKDSDSQKVDHSNLNITNVKFDPTGTLLLVSTSDGTSYLLDSFVGVTTAVLKPKRERNECTPTSSPCPLEFSFTPDGKYVFGGSHDGTVYCWRSDGSLLHKWHQIHDGPVRCLKFNPQYLNMASANKILAMWIDSDDIEDFVRKKYIREIQLKADRLIIFFFSTKILFIWQWELYWILIFYSMKFLLVSTAISILLHFVSAESQIEFEREPFHHLNPRNFQHAGRNLLENSNTFATTSFTESIVYTTLFLVLNIILSAALVIVIFFLKKTAKKYFRVRTASK